MPARRGAAQTMLAARSYAGDDAPEGAARTREFQAGLFPILVAGDVEAFRRYLGRWEETIGDTSDLADLPAGEQSALMARLLRRPQAYNLPPWPADLLDAIDEHPIYSPAGKPAPPPARPIVHAPPPAAEEPPPPTRMANGAYQVDMITGELVPVSPAAVAPPVRAAETPTPYDATPAAPRRRRRRVRSLDGLVQLELWASDG